MLTRIAPTPSGYLHKGNIYNFLLNWLWARANNGKVLLRIDDADAQRKRMEYVEDIFFVLDRLGLDRDIGPSGPDEFEKAWSQHHRRDLYEDMLKELAEAGAIYACSCSRSQLKEVDAVCNCKELNIPLHEKDVAWKCDMSLSEPIGINDRLVNLRSNGDFVVRKKDGWPAYPVTSLSDDLHYGVTHIARGEDLLESTARQLYLDSLLPEPKFHRVEFWHHPLLTNDLNKKISKSAGAQARSLLDTERPEDIFQGFAKWMGWDPEKYSRLEEMKHHPDFILSKS